MGNKDNRGMKLMKKIVVLEGGFNEEHEVSLNTSKEVQKSLKNRTLQDKKRRENPLIKVFNAVEIRSHLYTKAQMIQKMSKEIDKKLLFKYGSNFKTTKK